MKRLFFLITVTFIVCHCNAQTHPTEEGRVLTVLSADGKIAATVVTITGARVKLWDVKTGKMIKHLYISMNATHIRLNYDGSKLLIYDAYNKYSLMRDVDSGDEMEPVNDVWLNGRFARDNIRIAKTTISNSMLEILHPTDDSKSWRYKIKSKDKIYGVYLKESNTFIYAVKDKLYKKEGDTEDKPVLIGNFGRMENVSSDLRYGEYLRKIFSLESGEILWEPSFGTYYREFSPDAGTFALIKDDGLVAFYESQTGQLTSNYNLNTKIYTSNSSLSWEAGLLAYPKNETDVKIVNIYTGEEVMALDESQEYVRKVNKGMALVTTRDEELLLMCRYESS